MGDFRHRHLEREAEILYLLSQSQTIAQISQQLGKSQKVVKWHLRRMTFGKLVAEKQRLHDTR